MQEQFSELSRRYREEMLRLYGRKALPAQEMPTQESPTQEPEIPQESPIPQEIPMQEEPPATEETLPQAAGEAPTEPAENPEFTGVQGDYRDMLPTEFPQEYEEPTLPEYIRSGTQPQLLQDAADSMEDLTETGMLRVATLSGNSAFPVEGASVTISVRRNSREHLAYLLLTDESGETPTVSLPAPPASLSQQPSSGQPFTVVDVRVFANGYFRAEMLNVPIFAGVTSLQTFQLIPLPVLTHEDRETLSVSTESPDL